MTQERIKELMENIADNVINGNIQITSKFDGMQQYIPFDEVKFNKQKPQLEFYYCSDELAENTPSVLIPATNIENISCKISNESFLEDYSITMDKTGSTICIYANTLNLLSFSDNPDPDKSISMDTLIENLVAHETGIQILVNSGDVVDSLDFNVQIADAYFTKADDIETAICFYNGNQPPIRIENGKPIYHMSNSTSLFVHKARIERIEELPLEEYRDMFEMPSKAIYNVYMEPYADGRVEVVTIGLM